MLDSLVIGEVFAALLVFARVGGALMVMPGFGDNFVSPRIRLIFAVALTLIVTPGLKPLLPAMPASPILLALMLAGEIVIGIFLGTLARFLVTSLETAGMVVSHQLSLANAFVFNPAMATQGSLAGALIGTLGLVLIFVTDMHHLMIVAIVDSYSLFTPGAAVPFDDMANMISHLAGRSFAIGIQMAAPFVVVGLLFYLGLGLLARLMPQIQVFFIIMPAQIALGLLLFMLTLSASMMFWLNVFQDTFTDFLAPG